MRNINEKREEKREKNDEKINEEKRKKVLEKKEIYWYNRHMKRKEKSEGGTMKMNETLEAVRERERERATI